jgi:hypothetical protein
MDEYLRDDDMKRHLEIYPRIQKNMPQFGISDSDLAVYAKSDAVTLAAFVGLITEKISQECGSGRWSKDQTTTFVADVIAFSRLDRERLLQQSIERDKAKQAIPSR